MPIATINGIPLNYQVKGSGDLVVLVMGTGSPGRRSATPGTRWRGFATGR